MAYQGFRGDIDVEDAKDDAHYRTEGSIWSFSLKNKKKSACIIGEFRVRNVFGLK